MQFLNPLGDSSHKAPGSEVTIPVVAAVISRGERLLVCQRPLGKRHGGLWEFPGGKVGPGETVATALGRELREELAVEARHVHPAVFEVHDAGSPFVISFHVVEIDGEPQPLEHATIAWVSPADLPALAMAPSDALFAQAVLASR